jgi:hypothetical protein
MKHTLKGDSDTGQVWLDGELLDPKPSLKYHSHSPDGFGWGYCGSAPSQLALAIMLKITGKPNGYMDFKFNIIAALPFGKDFDIEFDHKYCNY